MKWNKILTAVFVAVALTSTPIFADAAPLKIKDNAGREWVVDKETWELPGAAGDPETRTGALIGLATDVEPTLAHSKHMFDLQFGFGGVGIAADDSAGTEKAISSISLQYYPPTESAWLKFGPEISWTGAVTELVEADKITVALPVTAYLFPDPFTAYRWGLELDMLPKLVVLTDPAAGGIRESAWTYVPGFMFFFEVPMGNWSAQVNAGASLPLQQEGVTDPSLDPTIEKGQFGFAAKINWRLGR